MIEGAEDRVAHWPLRRAVESDGRPDPRYQAADALAAPSGRQDERLDLTPGVIGLAVCECEGDAAGGLWGSIRYGACEHRPSGLRRSGGDQPLTRNVSVRRCLCLTQAPFREPGR